MSRQLKVDGELKYLQTVITRAVPVADGVKTVTDHANGRFTMIIRGDTVPDEWLTAAFALNVRRHDFGFGQEACMAWVFPVSAARMINQKFPILNEWIKATSSTMSFSGVQKRQLQSNPSGRFAVA